MMFTLPVRLVIYVVMLASAVTAFIEMGCRTDRYKFSQTWQIRFEQAPWQTATPLQNCRINLKHEMRETFGRFALDPSGEWRSLDLWYQALAAGIAAILGIAALDFSISAFRSGKRRTRDPYSTVPSDKRKRKGAPDMHDVRTRAKRRL